MATYLASELSVQGAAPRELYTFTLAAGVYRLTSADRDVAYDGQTYVATAGLSRGNIEVGQSTRARELVVTLPVNHAVVLALVPIPPRTATLTLERVHEGATTASTDRRVVWIGSIANVQIDGGDGEYARIRIPGRIDVTLDVRLPILHASRACQHQLYSVGCTVNRTYGVYATAQYMTACTVTSQTGSALVVSNMLDASAVYRGDGWAKGGEVRRVSDGERRSILAQVGTTLTLDVPFASVTAGQDLEVYAGCDHAVETCRDKFGNVPNFSGMPLLPTDNPASPTGRGVR